MALSSTCFCHSQFSLKMESWTPALSSNIRCYIRRNQFPSSMLKTINSDLSSQQVQERGTKHSNGSSFLGGSRVMRQPNLQNLPQRRSCRVSAMWLPSSQVASSVFTLGTAAVLPFYTLMVAAPKAELTRKLMGSAIPYVALGLLYTYLLYLSWTPDTIRLMFASKYWLPELSSIAKMFSSEMTLASAWIHLLAVDLFAARCCHVGQSAFYELVFRVVSDSSHSWFTQCFHAPDVRSRAYREGGGRMFGCPTVLACLCSQLFAC